MQQFMVQFLMNIKNYRYQSLIIAFIQKQDQGEREGDRLRLPLQRVHINTEETADPRPGESGEDRHGHDQGQEDRSAQ